MPPRTHATPGSRASAAPSSRAPAAASAVVGPSTVRIIVRASSESASSRAISESSRSAPSGKKLVISFVTRSARKT